MSAGKGQSSDVPQGRGEGVEWGEADNIRKRSSKLGARQTRQVLGDDSGQNGGQPDH